MRTLRMTDKRGFTIIELMIVVAIIGTLAAIAIPNFLKYRTKSRQTEAKIQLKAIFTSESTYLSENGFYSSDLLTLDWRPVEGCIYAYSIGTGTVGSASPGGVPMNCGTPAAGRYDFTAVAWSNIDNDSAIDTWQVTAYHIPDNVYNDVDEETGP